MTVSSPALADALAEIVGRAHVIDSGVALDAHAVDGVRPRWVARPGSVEETGGLLALAHAESLAVSPRGSGAATGLGNPPRRLDLVVALERLDAVTEYVAEDMVVSVEAGASLAALALRLREKNQMLTLDPIGGASRTIGGVLASNASGPLRFRYGTGRDLTLGVRFVQADGTITWGGAKVVKSVTGYDVPKLLVGSLGTIGIIVGATLRLRPLPAATGTWRLALPSPAEAESFLSALLDSGLEADRVTLLNGRAARACGQPDERLTFLVSVGSVQEAVLSQGSALTKLVGAHGGQARECPTSAWNSLGDALQRPTVLRLACEPKRLMFWLGELEQLASGLGVEVSVVAQAGNGMLQAALLGQLPGSRLEVDLVRPLRDGLASEGGSLVVERAPAELKTQLEVWGPIHPDSLQIMARLKREFDPDGVLNPGRFVGGL
jgi:glycolate oxidase FAD binding subunit